MVVETYSDKEVAVGVCEMAPEMFQEAIKITKEAISLPTNGEAAKKIKGDFDEKYGGNWMAIVGEGLDYTLLIRQKTSHISLLVRPNQLSSSRHANKITSND